jgi:hypothetical protein
MLAPTGDKPTGHQDQEAVDMLAPTGDKPTGHQDREAVDTTTVILKKPTSKTQKKLGKKSFLFVYMFY